MTPIPGSEESPLILVSPESQTPVASEPSNKRQRTLPSEFPVFTTPIGSAKIVESSQLVTIPKSMALKLRCDLEHDLILYKRPTFSLQLDFLDKSLITDNKRCWVVGPPGTGKSAAAFVFCRKKASQGWFVTWIKFVAGEPYQCVRFCGETVCDSSLTEEVPCSEILLTMHDSVNHLLVLDGYRDSDSASRKYLKDCTKWWRADKPNQRRLVIVASMAGRIDLKDVEEGIIEDEFKEDSWTLEEYEAACHIKKFASSVDGYLDATLILGATLADRIKAKFYFAGGCARYMFSYSTETTKMHIQNALSVSETLATLQCID
jgi:hypothetical protein